MTKFYNHPEYQLRFPEWETSRDLYEGKHEVLIDSKYLWMHEFEQNEKKGGDVLRALRQQRTRYTNHLKSIINRYVSLIFKTAPDFKAVEQLFGDDLKNVDGRGTTLQNFIKNKIAPCYFNYGKVAVVTDSFDIDAASLAEQRANNQRPFFELLDPFEIHDWSVDTISTNLLSPVRWMRTEYCEVEERTGPEVKPIIYHHCKVYSIVAGKYTIQQYKGKPVDQNIRDPKFMGAADGMDWIPEGDPIVIDGLKQTPIALVDQESWTADLCQKVLQLYNLESALDNQLDFQAFQRVFATGPFKSGDAIVMNEAGMTLLPEGCNVIPVEPSNPLALIGRINGVTATLFQLAFSKTRVLPADAKEIESAENQREAKEEFLATLINASNTIEQLVNTMVKQYAAFKGQKDFQGEVTFSKDITLEDVDQVTAMIGQFYDDIKAIPLWYKETMKGIAARMNFNDVEAIQAEIDKAEVPQAQEQNPAQARRDLLNAAVTGEAQPPDRANA